MVGLVEVIRAAIVVVLIVAAAGKLFSWKVVDREAFARFLPLVIAKTIKPGGISIIVGSLIFVELGTGLALLFPATVAVGFLSAGILFAIFAFATASLLWRGVPAPCQCFGAKSKTTVTWVHVARASALAVAAVVGLAASGTLSSQQPSSAEPWLWGVGLVAAMLLVRMDDLAFVLSGYANVHGERERRGSSRIGVRQ